MLNTAVTRSQEVYSNTYRQTYIIYIKPIQKTLKTKEVILILTNGWDEGKEEEEEEREKPLAAF